MEKLKFSSGISSKINVDKPKKMFLWQKVPSRGLAKYLYTIIKERVLPMESQLQQSQRYRYRRTTVSLRYFSLYADINKNEGFNL